MAIPDYQSIMLPMLELGGEGETLQLRNAVDILAQRFSLTDEEEGSSFRVASNSSFTIVSHGHEHI